MQCNTPPQARQQSPQIACHFATRSLRYRSPLRSANCSAPQLRAAHSAVSLSADCYGCSNSAVGFAHNSASAASTIFLCVPSTDGRFACDFTLYLHPASQHHSQLVKKERESLIHT